MAGCICGHPKEEHTEIVDEHNFEIGREWCGRDDCECEAYRAVLDWPDAEGWWWHEHILPANEWHEDIHTGGLIYAEHEHDDNSPIVIDDDDHPMETRDEMWARGGINRFVRLTEPNPFEKSNA